MFDQKKLANLSSPIEKAVYLAVIARDCFLALDPSFTAQKNSTGLDGLELKGSQQQRGFLTDLKFCILEDITGKNREEIKVVKSADNKKFKKENKEKIEEGVNRWLAIAQALLTVEPVNLNLLEVIYGSINDPCVYLQNEKDKRGMRAPKQIPGYYQVMKSGDYYPNFIEEWSRNPNFIPNIAGYLSWLGQKDSYEGFKSTAESRNGAERASALASLEASHKEFTARKTFILSHFVNIQSRLKGPDFLSIRPSSSSYLMAGAVGGALVTGGGVATAYLVFAVSAAVLLSPTGIGLAVAALAVGVMLGLALRWLCHKSKQNTVLKSVATLFSTSKDTKQSSATGSDTPSLLSVSTSRSSFVSAGSSAPSSPLSESSAPSDSEEDLLSRAGARAFR